MTSTFAAVLARYLVGAMLAWAQVPADCAAAPRECESWAAVHGQSADWTRERVAAIADAIANEATQHEAAPDEAVRQSMRLAALAFEESGFARYVAEGACNRTGRRADPRGSCDSGLAWTWWQVHLGWAVDRSAGRLVHGEDLLRDGALAAHVAWSILETRPRAWTTWPRASSRAERWIAAHGFDAESVDDASDAAR